MKGTALRILVHSCLGAAIATATGCAALTGFSQADINDAYGASDEAKLFDICEEGMQGALNQTGARGELDAEACDRYGVLQMRKLAAAIERGDAAFVQDTCDRKSSIDSHPTTGARLGRGYNAARYKDELPQSLHPLIEEVCRNLTTCTASTSEIACRASAWTARAGNDKAMEDAVATCDPDKVTAAFTEAFGETYGSNSAQQNWFVKAGVALMKCGEAQKTWVFEHWLHWGQGYGEALADALAPAGIDLEAIIVEHASRDAAPFTFKQADYAAGEAARWMRRNTRFDDCKPLVAAYPKMAKGAQFHWLWYFKDAKCKGAKPFAEALLGHENPGPRKQACSVLGTIGDAGSARKMKGLAASDPFWEWADGVKVFPVRDECARAINAIKAR